MKTIFSAILSIALVSVLLGAGTYAYFGDTETSTGNMFAAGTLDSKTSDNGVTYTAVYLKIGLWVIWSQEFLYF